VRFQWDPKKASSNVAKHGVSFDEAATVFGDPLAGTVSDPEHSTMESRSVTIGQSAKGRLVVVVHADRGEDIRIISARRATAGEKKKYAEGQEKDR
jgi:uncharacterized DUF497 family protein